MTAPALAITAYFDLNQTGNNVFTLDDPVKGVLDNTTYTLAGVAGTDITHYVEGASVQRGRERRLDRIVTGVATLQALNMNRMFDPEYAAGPFFGNLLPGRRFSITANGISIFDGNMDDFDLDYEDPTTFLSHVVFEIADALATIAATSLTAWSTAAGQTPGQRLAEMFNRAEVAFPAAQTAIDAGSSTLQGDVVAADTNTLSYAQTIADADLGELFASRSGTLTFFGRAHTVTGVGAPIFANDAVGLPYTNPKRARGTELLFNYVSVTATGSTAQIAQDPTSQGIYGIRAYPALTVPLADDDQALQMANYILSLYANPDARIASITILLHQYALADQNTVLALDLGSVVRVQYTPNFTAPAVDHFCMVEGIAHTIGPQTHTVTLSFSNLAAGFSGTPFVLDSTEFGVLDQNVLGF